MGSAAILTSVVPAMGAEAAAPASASQAGRAKTSDKAAQAEKKPGAFAEKLASASEKEVGSAKPEQKSAAAQSPEAPAVPTPPQGAASANAKAPTSPKPAMGKAIEARATAVHVMARAMGLEAARSDLRAMAKPVGHAGGTETAKAQVVVAAKVNATPVGKSGAAAGGQSPKTNAAPALGTGPAKDEPQGTNAAKATIRTAQKAEPQAATAELKSQAPATRATQPADQTLDRAGLQRVDRGRNPARTRAIGSGETSGEQADLRGRGSRLARLTGVAGKQADGGRGVAVAAEAAGSRPAEVQLAATQGQAATAVAQAPGQAAHTGPSAAAVSEGGQSSQVGARQAAGETPVAEQIAASMRATRMQAGRQIEVRLHPPELGRVAITVRTVNGEIRASIVVENTTTLERVQREAPVLMQRLQEDGVQMRRIDVVLKERDDGAGENPLFREGGQQNSAFADNQPTYLPGTPGGDGSGEPAAVSGYRGLELVAEPGGINVQA